MKSGGYRDRAQEMSVIPNHIVAVRNRQRFRDKVGVLYLRSDIGNNESNIAISFPILDHQT